MKDVSTNSETETTPLSSPQDVSPTINAFQFMMNNRHKSIGRNSPGRELEAHEIENNVDKSILKARKSKLEDWAEAKGASKRKREYEEVGNCIDRKLEERAKHFKQMLNVGEDEVRLKKKNIGVVDSDEDVSSKPKVTPKTRKSWKMKIRLDLKTDTEREAQGEHCEGGVPSNTAVNRHEVKRVAQPIQKENENPVADVILVDDKEGMNNNVNLQPEKRILRPRKPRTIWHGSSSDEDEVNGKKNKLKIAPVFVKSQPKPKLDPKIAEARRQFLLSGVPSSLKKEMEKQQCLEDADVAIFPNISHIQQKSQGNVLWNLPGVTLALKDVDKVEFDTGIFDFNTEGIDFTDEVRSGAITRLDDINKMKYILKGMKSQNPEYPIYKIFNAIYGRSGYMPVENQVQEVPKITVKRRGRKKKNLVVETEPVVTAKGEEKADIHGLWSEKYRPTKSCEILGNKRAVTSLKEWLTKWLTQVHEQNKKTKKKKKDSDSDFETTDGDSRDSTKLTGNTILLKGPNGSGKTTAIYAICEELGFNVLEVNASSRRTGKWLQQELQEATQSHQVRKKDNLFTFINDSSDKKDPVNEKMCVLLVEDVDLVFEQDEGFIAALCYLISTSKRPIVLTTTGDPVGNIQKLISDQQTIIFSPLSSALTTWLQIVCLVEGCYVDSSDIDQLLHYNNGDIRRTLLQLQIYVCSGGYPSSVTYKYERTDVSVEGGVVPDEIANIDVDNLDDVMVHIGCVDILGVRNQRKSFYLPVFVDLELIWWNLPTLLGISTLPQTGSTDATEKQKVKQLSRFYDSVAFTDVFCGSSQKYGYVNHRWRSNPKDGINLEEAAYSLKDEHFQTELANTLLQNAILYYHKGSEIGDVNFNMALPGPSEKRRHTKQAFFEEKLEGALLQADYLARRATALDYMPTLRTIARAECKQSSSSTKRRNRYHDYLSYLGVHATDVILKSVCDVFKINDEL